MTFVVNSHGLQRMDLLEFQGHNHFPFSLAAHSRQMLNTENDLIIVDAAATVGALPARLQGLQPEPQFSEVSPPIQYFPHC